MLKLLCLVGWHNGPWVEYAPDAGRSVTCRESRICLRCGVRDYRILHDVQHWKSDGFFSLTVSGVCIRCKQSQSRIDWELFDKR